MIPLAVEKIKKFPELSLDIVDNLSVKTFVGSLSKLSKNRRKMKFYMKIEGIYGELSFVSDLRF